MVLVPIWRQAVIRTNEGLVYWRIYASMSCICMIAQMRSRHIERIEKQSAIIKIVSFHDYDVIMGTIASHIISPTTVYSTVYSDADERKHQSSAPLAFVWGIHRGPVNSPHKWPVTRKMLPFDDVIMVWHKHPTETLWLVIHHIHFSPVFGIEVKLLTLALFTILRPVTPCIRHYVNNKIYLFNQKPRYSGTTPYGYLL